MAVLQTVIVVQAAEFFVLGGRFTGTSLEIFAPLTDVFRAVIPNSGFFGLERECAVIVQKEKEKKAVVVRVRAAWAGPD